MDFLSNLPKTSTKKNKRLGRGYGSGKGSHTVGRGQKGQKSRTKIHPAFMGTKVKKSLLQRLPLMRGRGKFKSLRVKTIAINLDQLNDFPESEVVTVKSLIDHKILKSSLRPGLKVKIMGDGSLSKPLQVAVPVSKSAQKKIESVKGSVLVDYE